MLCYGKGRCIVLKLGAAPFILNGKSPDALLFVHGFTASPSEVFPTAALINEMGDITVKGILLPGHGSSAEELNRTGWQDWSRAVNNECRSLQKDYLRVFVAGLSMGGMLTLHAGLQVHGLAGVVSINAPLFIRDTRGIRWSPLIKYWRPYWPKDPIDFKLREQGRCDLDCYPLKAMHSMWRLRKVLMKNLHAMRIPVLVIQSQMDETVLASSADFIVQSCRQASVYKVELPDSEHVATMGSEKEKIAAEIVRFINDIKGKGR